VTFGGDGNAKFRWNLPNKLGWTRPLVLTCRIISDTKSQTSWTKLLPRFLGANKGKCKVVPVQDTKACGGVEVLLHSFLTSVADGGTHKLHVSVALSWGKNARYPRNGRPSATQPEWAGWTAETSLPLLEIKIWYLGVLAKAQLLHQLSYPDSTQGGDSISLSIVSKLSDLHDPRHLLWRQKAKLYLIKYDA
jgi:hypothetical protein